MKNFLTVLAIAGFVITSSTTTLAQSTANYFYTTAATASLTNIASGSTQLVLGGNDDLASPVLDIGFDFWFMGTRYTQFSASSNGALRLGGSAISNVTYGTDFPVASQAIIAPYLGDLKTSSTGHVHCKVIGSAPNRTLVVEFNNMGISYASTTADGTFQARLYETSGIIEFVYGSMSVGSTSGNQTVVIGFSTNTGANNQISLSQSTYAYSISATPVTNTNSALGTITGLNSASDGSRRIFTFTPIAPTAPTFLVFSSLTQTGMTLNWTDNSSDELGFAIYRSDDNGTTYNFITQTAANVVFSVQSGLQPRTTYYWRVFAFREALGNWLSGNGGTLSDIPPLAQWSNSPFVNNPISTVGGIQSKPTITSDGSGGAIITWQDSRSGNDDIYAQRINASGAVQWTADGVAISTAAGDQQYPTIVSDGAGGAFITWMDYRSGTNLDIYAQRINASGAVQWTANGAAISTATGSQLYPTIVSDGAGGAIITWEDGRSSGIYSDIYAQRINASGAVQWTADGVAISTAADNQAGPTITSDGAGGAIITWNDYRSGTNYDIYAQRINASGAVQWTADGVAISTAAYDQGNSTITSDGTGGAIITWQDYRSGTNADIYAQRINASGAVQWTANGVAICTAAYNQITPTIVSDGAGGAIITWEDARNSGGDIDLADVYAQRISAAGTVLWTANGVGITAGSTGQYYPTIASDGAGGAIITWVNSHLGADYDIYAQRINASGAVQWTTNGVGISVAQYKQTYPTIVSDGAGGAIITWYDYRNGGIISDIYAQNVDKNGYLGINTPTLTAVRDVRGDQGGNVTVGWDRSYLDQNPNQIITYYSIWRGINLSAATASAFHKITPEEMTMKFAGGKVYRTQVVNNVLTNWEWIANLPSHYLASYSFTAPTTSDSMASGILYFKFFVSAQTANQFVFWDSNVDSGYSADNLSPIAPQNPAIAAVGTSSYHITWNQDRIDPDVAKYAVYRSTTGGFQISVDNRLTTTRDTSVTDSSIQIGQQYYYRLTAIDLHDNQSVPTNELTPTPLPIQIASFTASVIQSIGVKLEWTTVSETNNYGFYVERRPENSGTFATVSDLIPGAGTSLEEHHYTWTDANVTQGTYYYRLRQVDLNGDVAYSREIKIDVVLGVNEKGIPKEFVLEQNYPNPFNPSTVIHYQLPLNSFVTLTVCNVLGEEVATLVSGEQDAGYKSVEFDASKLTSGIYFYRLQSKNFIETKKMLLLK